jgi:hypothetical protein
MEEYYKMDIKKVVRKIGSELMWLKTITIGGIL